MQLPTPNAYVVQEHRQHCTGCGKSHSCSQVYAAYPVPGKSGRRLEPVNKPSELTWRLPIEHLQNAIVHQIPFCHMCHRTATLAHLREPPTRPATQAVNFPDPKTVPEPLRGSEGKVIVRTVKAKPAKRVFTLDDL